MALNLNLALTYKHVNEGPLRERGEVGGATCPNNIFVPVAEYFVVQHLIEYRSYPDQKQTANQYVSVDF